MFGPVLRGEKCTLRPPRKEELSIYQRWFEDVEVIHFLPGIGPLSDTAEEEWFNKAGADPNGVTWAIEVDGRPIGMTGIGRIDHRHQSGETGITVGDKSMWGKGVASEAMSLRTRFGFLELNLHKIRSRAFMENEASKRALQKAGYREYGVQREEFFRDGRWHDVWCAEVLREDWERAQRDGAPPAKRLS
jgi:RimJ/RimL family protein N-acetyltransferase